MLPRKSCLPRFVSARGSTASTPVSSFVAAKSGYVFCRRRIDVHQDHFGRIVTAGDRAPREVDERVAIEAGEPARPFAIEAVHRCASCRARRRAAMTCRQVSDGNPCSSISFGTSVPFSRTTAKSTCVKFGSASMPGVSHRAGMARFICARRDGSESCVDDRLRRVDDASL